MNTVLLLMTFASMPQPTSLWELTREAPLVLFAEVESISHERRRGVFRIPEEVTVRLRVKEVWKGPPVATVDVRSTAWSEGLEVVVFLELDDLSQFVESKGKKPARVWRSPRSLTMQIIHTQSQLAALKSAVINAATMRDDQRTEWGVAAFESEFTRHDALFELGRDATLTHDMLETLELAFIQKPTLDETLLSTMSLLRTHHSERLDLAFGFAIEQLAAREARPSWLPAAVELQAQRVKRRSVELRLLDRH